MILSEHKTYLVEHGAASISHSGSTLWAHLAGVHRILEASNSPAHVSVAGLFHSVYGTRAFKQVLIDRSRRIEVRSLIGRKAENLVWAFCNLPRPKLFEVSIAQQKFDWVSQWVETETISELWDGLVRLECANLLEQKTLYRFPCLVLHAQAIGMLDREGFSV